MSTPEIKIVYDSHPRGADIHYAAQKLSAAVFGLATSNGPLRYRLMDAYIEISLIRSDLVRPELVAMYDEIKGALTAKQPKLGEEQLGSLVVTLRHMHISKLTRVARGIYELADRVNAIARAEE